MITYYIDKQGRYRLNIKGGTVIYGTSLVSSYSVLAGEAKDFITNGTYYYVK